MINQSAQAVGKISQQNSALLQEILSVYKKNSSFFNVFSLQNYFLCCLLLCKEDAIRTDISTMNRQSYGMQ